MMLCWHGLAEVRKPTRDPRSGDLPTPGPLRWELGKQIAELLWPFLLAGRELTNPREHVCDGDRLRQRRPSTRRVGSAYLEQTPNEIGLPLCIARVVGDKLAGDRQSLLVDHQRACTVARLPPDVA